MLLFGCFVIQHSADDATDQQSPTEKERMFHNQAVDLVPLQWNESILVDDVISDCGGSSFLPFFCYFYVSGYISVLPRTPLRPFKEEKNHSVARSGLGNSLPCDNRSRSLCDSSDYLTIR